MPRPTRDEDFSAFVQTKRTGLVRSACLLTAGDTHLAEDLVQTALARLCVAWPKVRRSGTEAAYVWRIIVNAHIDEVRRARRRREHHVPELPETAGPVTFPDGLVGGEVRAALAALPPRMRGRGDLAAAARRAR
jgi:DNA-directed RNA polymerase specialized sigma24 family protein